MASGHAQEALGETIIVLSLLRCVILGRVAEVFVPVCNEKLFELGKVLPWRFATDDGLSSVLRGLSVGKEYCGTPLVGSKWRVLSARARCRWCLELPRHRVRDRK